MTQKVKRFKQGSSVSGGSKPLQNLDYNLISGGSGGGGGGGGGSRDFRMSPTTISQPSSTLGSMTGGGPPRGYGIKLTKRFKEGGKTSAAEAVHKHERAKHKGQPLTKMAKGGSASKRGDGCCSKGKTKGRMV